jgi:hypothetical protein
VTRAISALTLRQYANALSQIKKGIGVSVGSITSSRSGGEIRTMAWAFAAEAASVFP